MPKMLNLEAIAAASGLTSQDAGDWSDAAVPLSKRGVSLTWLKRFLDANGGDQERIVDTYKRDKRYSIMGDVPWPEPLPWDIERGALQGASLVSRVIRPLTVHSATPLYAHVPEEHRGPPDVFVSHAWANPLIASLHAIHEPYRKRDPVEFVWLDLVCYNQHRVEAIAGDMQSVISAIGRVALATANTVPFQRLWCLWELLCAHLAGARVELCEITSQSSDLGLFIWYFESKFESVERAETTTRRRSGSDSHGAGGRLWFR
jgi:hypothetical protein